MLHFIWQELQYDINIYNWIHHTEKEFGLIEDMLIEVKPKVGL